MQRAEPTAANRGALAASETAHSKPAQALTNAYCARSGSAPAFAVSADQPLLRSAEAAGLAWPSSCRNGACRACMQQLDQGRVIYRIEWPGLLAEEKFEGWILPCVAYPDSDLVLRQPAEL